MTEIKKIIIRTPCIDCNNCKDEKVEVTEEEMDEYCDLADQEVYDMDYDDERQIYVFTRNNQLCPACTDKFNDEQQ